MPKRPNPSDKDKDDGKKARSGSSPDDDGASASLTGKMSTSTAAIASPGRVSTAASRVAAAAAAAAAVLPLAAATKTTPASSSSKAASSSTKSNGGSGGNAFLKSVRAVSGSMNNSVEAKINTPIAASTSTKNKSRVDHTPNGSDIPTIKEPTVPFPYLPHKHESKLKRWAAMSALFLLNMAAVVYVASQQSWHNLIKMRRTLEINKLYDELAVSQNEVNILRHRMNGLEQAREARDKMLTDDQEVFTGLFGPQVGGGEELLTSEERNAWLENLRLLEVDTQSALDELNKNLSEFEDGI